MPGKRSDLGAAKFLRSGSGLDAVRASAGSHRRRDIAPGMDTGGQGQSSVRSRRSKFLHVFRRDRILVPSSREPGTSAGWLVPRPSVGADARSQLTPANVGRESATDTPEVRMKAERP